MKQSAAPFIPADAVSTFGHLDTWIKEHEAYAERIRNIEPALLMQESTALLRPVEFTATALLAESTAQLRQWAVVKLHAIARANNGVAPVDQANQPLSRDAQCTALMDKCEALRREAEKYAAQFQRAKASSEGVKERHTQAKITDEMILKELKALREKMPNLNSPAIRNRVAHQLADESKQSREYLEKRLRKLEPKD